MSFSSQMEYAILGIVLVFASIRQSHAFFGLTSSVLLPDVLSTYSIRNISNHLYDGLVTNKKLNRFYGREKAFAETLANAIQLSSIECGRQFRYERWNCSIDSVRLNLLKEAYPETAFLYSITSASLVYTIARSCSSGKLRHCTCDDNTLNATENKKTWIMGGCGDNIKFGARFTQRFLLKRWKHAKDLRAVVERHNSEIGIKIVRKNVSTVCKCHGISGSCTIRTCWQQLSSFSLIGSILKRKYLNSIKAKIGNDAVIGRTKRKRRRKYHTVSKWRTRKRKEDAYKRLGIAADRSALLYLAESPNFCGPVEPWVDTKDRECLRGINCETLCCGRGYNSRVVISNVTCKCRVIWCCNVRCDVCQDRREIYTCK